MTKRLIITADDMGYNVERNRGIIECFKNNAVTNSSLMVNGVASEDAANLALSHGLPTGLHFNITEGVPVWSGSKYVTLTNEKGHFLGKCELRSAVKEEAIDLKEVRQELTNQIARYTELMGSRPAYVDGHQHANIIPGLVKTFVHTLSDHGIFATRLPYELNIDTVDWVAEPHWGFLREVSDNAKNIRQVLKTNNIWTSDAFYGLATMGSNMTCERLQSGVKEAFASLARSTSSDQTVTCELMTHPGYINVGPGGCGEGPDDFSKSPDREHEKSVLESEEMKLFYNANGITLVSYHSCLAI